MVPMIEKRSTQKGAVLVALMCGALLFIGVGMLGGHLATNLKQQSQREVTESLSRVKQALISYAVNYADNYGHNTRGGVGRLPCPALAPHSRPAMRCGLNAIGYLPAVWSRDSKRIDIDHLEYFFDQNLWYAVSADFRYNPAFNKLNPDSSGRFLSVNQHDEVVAVIIHPGVPLAGQSRGGDLLRVTDYLEGESANGDSIFEFDPQYNDHVVFISRSELMPLIEKRVLGISRDWLLEYSNTYGHLPFAAKLGDPLAACEQGLTDGILSMARGNCLTPSLGEFVSQTVPRGRRINQTWFGQYNWANFVYYQVDPACVSDTGVSCSVSGHIDGELIVNDQPARALLVSTGRAIESAYLGELQDRLNHPTKLSSYLDTAEFLTGSFNLSIVNAASSIASNDQYLVVR